jgi:hypothetical protein
MIIRPSLLTDPAPAKQKRSKAKKAGIIIGIVVAALVGLGVIGLVAVNIFHVGTVAYVPSTIIVSGTASTTGPGTHPVAIMFIDQGSGGRITNEVDSNGYYSVQLPNGDHTYNVQIAWEGLVGSKGICDASPLHFSNELQTMQSHNFRC